MSQYGDGDGNIYALDKYLQRQDDRDEAWASIIKKVDMDVESSVELFKAAMDEFHAAKARIVSELEDYGIDDSNESVMYMMYDCGDNDIIEQMEAISW